MKRILRYVIHLLLLAVLKVQEIGSRMENLGNRMLAWNERQRAKWT